MTWIKIDKIVENEKQIYARIDDDGLIRFSCVEEDPTYQAYLAAQSTPIDTEDEE
jgi:hypothetical protein